ncbi:D-alanyl-lipoteichoic acid acyltransferase DltB (MBOAT superfamily) [Marinisporobacter balticus]|uniref:D-alanyl-lipoteichoic acid acyltransferase DltB (MBOAT superfamily) n=1 Tax=Marinisporobacter balticus TaxID=2018667 RepID=A0A4V2SAW1_9FIRM|nr:D-alanyl-lipoteichoic acid acyltransferase DltB (MBOAT superfamily) [Marinisporobacter balticus]
MLFHTFEFFVLLFVTFFSFYIFPKKRIYILALANIIFYGASGTRYLLLFLIVSLITYLCSLKLETCYWKIFYLIGILVVISNLLFFKYTGFVLNNLEKFMRIHFPWQDSLLSKILLPVGISFYTFQLIAYLVDVKRKEIKPCDSFINFWVFISFFGQLIAGPIMRGKEFLPQIENLQDNKLTLRNFKYGFYYIIMGLTKKIIFADFLASKADFYFNQVGNLNSLDAWFASYLFAFQIYFDFSAYSEIAVGVGYLFGLYLNINFKSPYISASPSEFWKRWHITLSSWIKDYIYIPLGGAKKGTLLQYMFLIIAMAISGLWHGAAWTFIMWGIYHGLLSAFHKIYRKWIKLERKNSFYKILSIFIFFNLTTIGWVFFRAKSIHEAVFMIKKMITLCDISFSHVYFVYFGFIALLYGIHILEYFIRNNEITLKLFWEKHVPTGIRAAAYMAILIILILLTKTEESSFIYFQF